MRAFGIICATLLISACSLHAEEPFAVYEGPFADFPNIPEIERVFREASESRGLRVLEEDKDSLVIISRGRPAFLSIAYKESRPILFLSNAGAATRVKLIAMARDHEEALIVSRVVDEFKSRSSAVGLNLSIIQRQGDLKN